MLTAVRTRATAAISVAKTLTTANAVMTAIICIASAVLLAAQPMAAMSAAIVAIRTVNVNAARSVRTVRVFATVFIVSIGVDRILFQLDSSLTTMFGRRSGPFLQRRRILLTP